MPTELPPLFYPSQEHLMDQQKKAEAPKAEPKAEEAKVEQKPKKASKPEEEKVSVKSRVNMIAQDGTVMVVGKTCSISKVEHERLSQDERHQAKPFWE